MNDWERTIVVYRMPADHAAALRRAEEQGYARGLHDASQTIGMPLPEPLK